MFLRVSGCRGASSRGRDRGGRRSRGCPARQPAVDGHRLVRQQGENIGTIRSAAGAIIRNSAKGLFCRVTTKWYEYTLDPCGTSLPWASASAEIFSNSVMPPHQPTSGCRMSAHSMSSSSRKPNLVASCSPVVTSMPGGTRWRRAAQPSSRREAGPPRSSAGRTRRTAARAGWRSRGSATSSSPTSTKSRHRPGPASPRARGSAAGRPPPRPGRAGAASCPFLDTDVPGTVEDQCTHLCRPQWLSRGSPIVCATRW